MKKNLALAAVGAALLAFSSSEASAWYCVARSGVGTWGWATNYNRSSAQYNSLLQCAARTPRGYMCYVRFCR
jgi:hypothetical protein